MNKRFRVSAKTVEDAITEALIQLGVTSDHIEYEVIEKGSAGFLGIGVKQAVIEVWKKEEKREERREPKRELGQAGEIEEAAKEPASVPAEEPHEEIPLAPVEEKTITAVEDFLRQVFAAMDMEVALTLGVDAEGALSVEMEGPHMGLLIGKRGQTLDALQYLANRVANKQQEGYVRVKLDTENYRARRKETLEHLAKNIAHKVKRNRRSFALEPMNPYERRIIHAVLQADPDVTTHSEGEEPYRKVVVTYNR